MLSQFIGEGAMVETRIGRVTVYRNGALVVRVGRVEPGTAELGGLPLLFASDSLRVRAAGGEVREVRETCRLEHTGPGGPESRRTEERLRLELERRALHDERAAVESRMNAYERATADEGKRTRVPSADALLEIYAHATARIASLEARIRGLDERLAENAAAARELQRETSADPQPPRYVRGVTFEVVADAPCDLEVEYFVVAARWLPTYTLDVRGGEAAIQLHALVAQASGEDWSGAEVQVATADLARETTLPELTSWRIGTAQPRRRPRFRPPPEGLGALFEGYDQLPLVPAAAEPPQAPPEPMVEAYGGPADDEITGVDLDEEWAEAEEPMPMMASMAPPPPPMSRPAPPPAPAAPMAKRARMAPAPTGMALDMARAGGGGGFEPPTSGSVRPPGGDLPQRLRYPYLRLAGPDEPSRGELTPLDALAHLWSLVEDHQAADHGSLRRAVEALVEEGRRLRRYLAAPPGCREPEGFHQLYSASGAHEVPGDGQWHRLTVHQTTAPAEVEYRTVPRESHDVFRFCTIRPEDRVPLPSGPLRVHIDGTYRVTAALKGSGGGEPLELNLGLEPAVRVVERKAHAKQQEKGLMSSTTRVDHSVVVRVRSGISEAARLRVFDRLPVPVEEEKDIHVTLLESTPPAQETDRSPHGERLEGGVSWVLEMAPGAVSHVAWQYRVELPTKQEIVGGNRRE